MSSREVAVLPVDLKHLDGVNASIDVISTQLAGGQLKQLRNEAVHLKRNKRSKGIEKNKTQENQRSWSLQ